MAHLTVDGSDLVMVLNRLESLGSMHGSVRVPLTNVASINTSNTMWDQLRGIRMPGTGFPHVIALGTWRYSGGKDFVAVYGRRGVVATLTDPEWKRLIVSCRNPQRACQQINAH